jgi:hypothetical protein
MINEIPDRTVKRQCVDSFAFGLCVLQRCLVGLPQDNSKKILVKPNKEVCGPTALGSLHEDAPHLVGWQRYEDMLFASLLIRC